MHCPLEQNPGGGGGGRFTHLCQIVNEASNLKVTMLRDVSFGMMRKHIHTLQPYAYKVALKQKWLP